jgi:glycosyltransferase involved in cell wall biosynthesis
MSDTDATDKTSETQDAPTLSEASARSSGEMLSAIRQGAQQGVFRAVDYVAEPAPGFNTRGVWFSAGLNYRSGYAHVALADALLIKSLGVPSFFIPHRAEMIDWDIVPEDRKGLLEEYQRDVVGIGELLIAEWPPHEAIRMTGVTDGFVMRTTAETDRVSQMAADMCNIDAVDKVWFPSEFARQSFIAGGVKEERTRTLLPPVIGDHLGLWQPKIVPNTAPIDESNPFNFGAMGTFQARKGFTHLIRAYYSAFSAADPVVLTIRTSPFGRFRTIQELRIEIERQVRLIRADFGPESTNKGFPRIRFLVGTELTDKQMIEWLGSLDCYANPSFGEGTGLPLLYARASGVPIVTNLFGGVAESMGGDFGAALMQYLDGNKHSYDSIVPHTLKNIPSEMLRMNSIFEADLKWADYVPQEMGEAMRWQFERGRRRNELGARITANKFSAERLRPIFLDALSELVDVSRWMKQP